MRPDIPQVVVELTVRPLPVIGARLEKTVYGAERWVVKRQQSLRVTAGYFMVWRLTPRWVKRLAQRLLSPDLPWGESTASLALDGLAQTRLEQAFRWRYAAAQLLLAVAPSAWWRHSGFGREAAAHQRMDREGHRLAEARLEGAGLVPRRVTFPPIRVRVQGWPGILAVSEAYQRTDQSLRSHLHALDADGRGGDVLAWLDRVAALQPRLWARGVFNADINVLSNYGLVDGGVVLVDSGRLTDDPEAIHGFLDHIEEFMAHNLRALTYLVPHHPEARDHFEARWRALLTRENVRAHWPALP